ncbi:hypothetical protein QBC33DRAFT_516066 [Phialemonium atrogriseum]|uniref:Uncharacterized protein n=1 Tax=Phialemonium atrogriseum TaxID=1093897 RepID=A0AAJ0BZV0_9PEZI|nr:uncharacterized protein QBC33DRAFT_516066 [Phialemonium atrogriseum]KAK1766159.1 hypothetical protein QBC33DRAFT_516066 [Phialemonium atrogriseum]
MALFGPVVHSLFLVTAWTAAIRGIVTTTIVTTITIVSVEGTATIITTAPSNDQNHVAYPKLLSKLSHIATPGTLHRHRPPQFPALEGWKERRSGALPGWLPGRRREVAGAVAHMGRAVIGPRLLGSLSTRPRVTVMGMCTSRRGPVMDPPSLYQQQRQYSTHGPREHDGPGLQQY